VTLFAIGDAPIHATRTQMLAVSQVSRSSDTWKLQGDAGEYELKPFASIGREKYRLYHELA
jgi:hypothetical protein